MCARLSSRRAGSWLLLLWPSPEGWGPSAARSGLWTQSQQGQGCGHRVSKVRAVDTESARSGLWTQQGQGCGHTARSRLWTQSQQGQGCGHRHHSDDLLHTVLAAHRSQKERGGKRERKTTTTALCLYPGYTVDCLGKMNLDHTEWEKQTSAACYNMFHEQSLKHIFFYLVPNNAVPPHF